MSVPDALRRRAGESAESALDQVRSFLRGYVADADSLDELRDDLARSAEFDAGAVLRRASAIEALVTQRHPPRTLATLVALEGNWVLDEQASDDAAAQWLRSLAATIREVVARSQPVP